MRRGAHWAVLACGLLAAAAATAQQQLRPAPRIDPDSGPAPAPALTRGQARAGFLLLNQERLLTDSVRGKALLAEEEAARERLRNEARAVETAFEAEERELTERRASLSAEEFRVLADDFDERVVRARQDQDAKASALAVEFDQRRRAFYADVAPVLVGVMESFGASAILDETSVLLADQALNITDEVIAALDAAPRGNGGAEGGETPGPDAPAPGEAPGAPATGDGG